MSKDTLFAGPEVTLEAMLAAREARVQYQSGWLRQYPDATVISFTLNIPGPVKTSPDLHRLFQRLFRQVKDRFKAEDILDTLCLQRITGELGLIVLQLSPVKVKTVVVGFEERHPLGRLCDVDVLFAKQGKPVSISRQDLGYPDRTCYLCGQPAKECGRSRRHSVPELQAAICQLIQEKGAFDDEENTLY